MATQYGFKRVKGVETSNELCDIARRNVLSFEKKAKRALPVEVIESDVLQYRVDDEDNVFYFFKPFDGVIMKQLVESIKASLAKTPRKVWLVFNNFKYHDLLSGEQNFRRKLDYAYGGTEFVVYESDL